ncbi:hypothetical protein DSCW_30250 [Desulfosarcina widdelii]|uniref:DUF106 domain-containing protein n=1 Tax=Desulfosarcina widdelii TaxID=947919 RepID=A0A5K7Z3P9_9BACT|nr:hypothetical protein [Desulfosarcina widdelii]BBO75608.1 hypothetical protein DSCW_30250 [Desulfosarcina widdelii]
MEQWLEALFKTADPQITRLFLLTRDPVINFFIGSFLLAFGCVVVGEITLLLAIRWNRNHIEGLKKEIRNKEKLSIQAYEMGDRDSYRALNKDANDAWGRHFFTMTAYSAGVLWPVPFALGWFQIHYGQVRFLLAFPFSLIFGETVGFAFSFIPVYILCRILFRYLHPWLPYFKEIHGGLEASRS